MQFERFSVEMTDWKNHRRRNATKSGERTIIKSMGGEPGESVDRELAPKFPVISGATVWNAPKHEIRAIVRGSFCAWHNHRDFFAISWNIWAICLRDERRPAGCLTARFTLSPLLAFLSLPAAGYTRRLHDHRRIRFFYRNKSENRQYFRHEWILDARNVNFRHQSRFLYFAL